MFIVNSAALSLMGTTVLMSVQMQLLLQISVKLELFVSLLWVYILKCISPLMFFKEVLL